jgi:hypothetical protein
MRSSSSRLKGSGSPAANRRVETLLYVVLGPLTMVKFCYNSGWVI